jgi:molecular chaperone DnaJ
LENYYDVLGVSENATQEDIKKAFRQKSKEHHPDRGGNEEEFKRINEAYSSIGDEQKRAEYDNQRNNPFAGMGGNPFGGDPFDIFASMFGGGQAQRRAPDKVLELKIGAIDSFLGKELHHNFTRKKSCGTCGGQGGERTTCNHCGGSGVIMQRMGNAFFQNVVQTSCPHCSGRGFNFKNLCNSCFGDGRVDEGMDLKMNIPVGISDGQMIRAGSMGDFANGTYGDVIFKVVITEQDGFEKSNGDLVYNKFMSLSEFNQEELEIPHPHGELRVKLPKTIDTSKPLKVGGKGYTNERGDFYIKLNVKHTRL